MSGKAIRETLGFLAVVASMVFVALEIGQNTASIRAQTRQQLSDANSEFLIAMATSDLGDLWARFAQGEELGEREMNRLGPALVAGVRGLENVYLQFLEGVIDESALASYGWKGSTMYGSAAFAAWWPANSDRFHPDFRATLEAEYGLAS